MLNLKGSGVALVTPFTDENTINFEKLEELIEFQICNKTDFLVICGTTGEASTLTFEEYTSIVEFVVKKVNKRIPVIVGSGSNNTNEAIKKSKVAYSLGADGVLVVTPYYNKGNDIGIYTHYQKVAESIYPLPVILYNVPSRTGVNLSNDLILKLANMDNIIGIKEANNSIEKVSSLLFSLKRLNLDFKVFSGNDNLTIPILALGGSGVISVCANIIPNDMYKICRYEDIEIYSKYYDLMNVLFVDTNPIMIKEAMNLLNFNVGNVRLPLYKTTNENLVKLKEVLEKIPNLKKDMQ